MNNITNAAAEIDPTYDPENDGYFDTTKPGETLLGYDGDGNVTAISHRLGDIKTLIRGQPFEIDIENEGDEFGVYITTLTAPDAEGMRTEVSLWGCKVSREDLTKLVTAPPNHLPQA